MKTPKSIIAVVSMLLAFACFAVIIGNTPKSSAESYNVTTTEKTVSTTEASTEDYQPPSSGTTRPAGYDGTKEVEYQYSVNNYGEAILTSSKYACDKVVIPSEIDGYKVTGLGVSVFYENDYITEVEIPEGIKEIQYSAFYGCENLKKVKIPFTVTAIRSDAFFLCYNLSEVEFAADKNGKTNLKTIEPYAFACPSLKSIKLPEGVETIGLCAFGGKRYGDQIQSGSGLTSISLPASVTYCDGAFEGNSVLESIHVAEENERYSSVDGVLYNKDKSRIIIYPVKKTGTEFVIPKTVTEIRSAFYNQACLEKITFENGTAIEVIGKEAFYGCEKLKSFSVPATVKRINGSAFGNCASIESFWFESDNVLTTIETGAFQGCAGIKSLELPSTVESLGVGAFARMSSLTEFTVPARIGEINNSAFKFCSALKKIVYADSSKITKIDREAFQGCKNLREVTVPENVTDIEDSAFEGCESIVEIDLPEGLKRIENYAFSGVKSLSKIEIPASVEYIGKSAFYKCSSLEEVSFAEGSRLRELGDGVFSTSGIKSISFANISYMEEIPAFAFTYCANLSSVDFGEEASITSVGNNAFMSCSSLSDIDFPDSLINVYSDLLFDTSIYKNQDYWEDGVFYFDGILIRTADDFSAEELQIKDGTRVIAANAFSECRTLRTIHIPDSVETVGESAFHSWGGNDIETVTGGNGIINLGKNAFLDTKYYRQMNFSEPVYICSVLVKVPSSFGGTLEVKEGTLAIASEACEYNRNIKKIVLPEGLVNIGYRAFMGCSSLSEIVFAEGLKRIESEAFYNANLTEVEFPSTLEYIGASAFSNCKFSSLEFPASITTIETFAFDGAKEGKLTEVVFEKGSKLRVLNQIFNNCYNIEKVVLPDSLQVISGTFSKCTKLTEIELPSSLERIGASAFAGCNLSTVTIPDNVTEIESSAFANNKNLKDVYISESSKLRVLSGAAFSYCDNLMQINVPASVECFDLYSMAVNSSSKIIDVYYSGNAADWCKIRFDNSLLYVGGTRVRYNLFFNNKSAVDIVIPSGEGLTRIPDRAFAKCNNLKSIVIPEGVKSIDYEAFAGCYNLKSISLPSTLELLDKKALSDCNLLSSISVPSNNKFFTLENGVLYNKDKTELIKYPAYKTGASLVIPKTVNSITENAFYQCRLLQNIKFERGTAITKIGDYAFASCGSVTSIVLPDTVKEIGREAFYNCYNLTFIDLANAEKMGFRALAHCQKLSSLVIPNTMTETYYDISPDLGEFSYGYSLSSVFEGSGITKIEFEEGTTKIPEGVCFMCDNLETVIIPDSVTEIGAYAFHNSSVENVVIPNSVEIIGGSAFAYYFYPYYEYDIEDEHDKNLKAALKSVTFGSGSKIKRIKNLAFGGRNFESFYLPISVKECYSIPTTKDLYYGGELRDWCMIKFTGPLPFEKLYFDNELFDKEHLIVPETLTEIGGNTFAGFDFVKTVSIPKTVTLIDSKAFYNCENIVAVNFENAEADVVIGESAFEGCKNLKNITVPKNTRSIGESAFKGCTGLERIKLPDNIHSVPYNCFNGCTALEEVEISENCKAKNIFVYAFYNCSSLEKIFIPKDVVRIYDDAFAGCTSLTRFDVSAENEVFSSDDHGVLYDKAKIYLVRYPMGNRAEEYQIPATVKTINSDGGFAGAKYLSRFKVATANEHFSSDESGVLFNKDKTQIIVYPVGSVFDRYAVPESVTFLNVHVFANHNNLRSVFVPSTVESLNYFWAYRDTYDYPLTVYFELTQEEEESKIDDRISHMYYENLVKVYNHSQHSFDTVTFEATCSHSGYSGMMCECGMVDGELTLLARTPHTPGEWEIERDSTDTEEGLRSMTCTVCGEKYKEEIIPKKSAAVSEDGVKVLYDKDDYEGEIEVIIEPANDDKIYEVVGGEYREENLRPYDIKMLLDGEEIQPNGKVKVRIPLPKGFDPYKTVIYYVNTKTGEKELIQSMFSYNDDGYIEFETDHFSYYVLAYKAKTATAVSYKINWNVDGAVTTVYLEAGDEIVIPQAPVKEGYTFIGWSPDVPDTMPAEDLTFIAVFEKNEDKPVTPPDVGKAVSISIRKPTTTTVNYGDTLILHATVSTLPDGCSIKWTVEGTGVKLSPSADGMTCSVTCTGSGAVSVKATVVDANGNAMSDTDGQEASANQNLTAKAGFFQKLISFFKNLFGANRIIAQAFKNIF